MRSIELAASVEPGKCKEPPCRRECPAGVNVPLYIDLIKNGRLEEAYQTIRTDNPFPSVCGRICPSPCEGECRRGVMDAAVAIRALKRFPGDYLVANGGLPAVKTAKANGHQVAVVGGGPAGLTAAFCLARKGYAVTVFEEQQRLGGMMAYGIPEYRLPKSVLQREIEMIEGAGVKMRTGVRVGTELPLEQLLEQGFEAVFLAVGAKCDNVLDIPGAEYRGVLSGIGFLRTLNEGEEPDFTGKKIAVVGGGNVASDAARSALRQGAETVTVYYRRTRGDMTASDDEIREMEREGVVIEPLVAPTKVLGADTVTGLRLTRMRLGDPDSTGRGRPVPIEDSEFEVAADVVISAVGYHPEAGNLSPALTVSRIGSVSVDRETLATSIRRVYSGGDCVTGPTNVISAVAEGKRGAASIDRLLGGDGAMETSEPDECLIQAVGRQFRPKDEVLKRVLEPVSGVVDAKDEAVLGYSLEQALQEADRCLHCDLVCHTCENLCPTLAIHSKAPGQREWAVVDLDMCSGCGMCEQRCPNQAITMVPREKKVVCAPKVDVTLTERVAQICAKAHMQPRQVICYCHRVLAEEVVSAILSGAKTPEEIACVTGARTGCGVLCMTSILRILKASGVVLDHAPGNQWYGGTPTIWTLSEEVLDKYDSEFHLRSDKEGMNHLFPGEKSGS